MTEWLLPKGIARKCRIERIRRITLETRKKNGTVAYCKCCRDENWFFLLFLFKIVLSIHTQLYLTLGETIIIRFPVRMEVPPLSSRGKLTLKRHRINYLENLAYSVRKIKQSVNSVVKIIFTAPKVTYVTAR